MATEKMKKNENFFSCENCDFITSKKTNYDLHIQTQKHTRNTLATNGNTKNEKMFICDNCGKKYKDRTGLWRHNKKCTPSVGESETDEEQNLELYKQPTDKNLIMILIKENSELKNMMLEQQTMMMKVIENGTHITTTNNTNSHNKAFNLNFFLNETCKDAMNIMDFVDSIQYQLSDLEKMGEIGYVEGLSNIIVKNLNALDVTQRPIHCTDKKRETIYIKDQDKWEKDEDKNKIRKAIKRAALKNARLIQKFKEKHPDYNEYHSKYSTQYHKLIIESFGGSGDNDVEKEDKIIRNISKNIVVDK